MTSKERMRGTGDNTQTNKERTRGIGDNTQTNEDSIRTRQGGVVTCNKEAGQEEHMADNNKDRAMC